jgi:hypothetical protein
MNDTGRIRLYTISIGNDGIPMISHTFDVLPREEDKIEEGGTEIRVPVDQADRTKLIDGLVSQQFCWFDKNVNFGGAFDSIKENLYLGIIKISDRMYMARPSKAQAEKFSYSADWKVFVRQGAAVYDVSLEQIRYKLKSEYITALKALCTHNRHILIDLPIGTVDVTMAREGIQYNNTSTDNLVNTIETAMADLEISLAAQVGDAHEPVEALKRLAIHFIPDAEERTKFTGLKLAASLLPLVVKILRKNYEVWYETAPLVKFVRFAKNAEGEFYNDENGAPVTEEYEDKRAHNPPVINPSFRASDFASGKVHITEAAVFSHGTLCGIVFDSVTERINVNLPNAFYVVPLHLAKWKERISAHVQKTFAADEFPMTARDGLKVYVIRAAKKNIVSTLNKLREHGVLMAHFVEEDLPTISTGTSTSTRQTSKNAVNKFLSSSWDNKTKIDPDFTQPAYYLERVGQTGECYTARPGGLHSCTTEVRKRVGEYQIEKILHYGRKLGILDKTYPVYRLTEKQATRIERMAPSWIPLVDHVAVAAEKLQSSNVLAALSASTLSMSGDYTTRHFVNEGLRGDRTTFDSLYKLCMADPLFCAVVGVRHVWNNATSFPELNLNTDQMTEGSELQNLLFGKALGVNDVQTKYLNQIADAFEGRYGAISSFVTTRSDTRSIKNMQYYVYGLVEMTKDEISKQDFHIRYTEVNNIVEAFKKKLDEMHARLYPVATVTLEELGATGND